MSEHHQRRIRLPAAAPAIAAAWAWVVSGVRTFAPPAAVAVAVAWAWVGSGVRTFTRPAEVITFLPGLAVLALTLRPSAQLSGRTGTSNTRAGWRGALAWVAVAAAVTGWELVQLFEQPRHLHPTLSSVFDSLLSTHPSRFIGYLAWLALGWLLVRDLGGRRE
jgi:hypothetical protein